MIHVNKHTISPLNEYFKVNKTVDEMKQFQKRTDYSPSYDSIYDNDDEGYLSWHKKKASFFDSLGTYNCHIGQLKLFYALFQYLLILKEKDLLNNSLIVYIGSAPGFNIYCNLQYFPEITLLLYDPAKFDRRLYGLKNVIIKDNQDGFFGLDKIDEVKQVQKQLNKKHIVFISDIRLGVDEESIMRDNALNMKSILRLKCASFQLKFRVPYYISTRTPKETERLSTYDLDDIDLEFVYGKKMIAYKPEYYNYLKGTIYYQLFAPPYSAESRLVGFSKNGSYKLDRYSLKDYESNFIRFNICRNFFDYSNVEPYKKLISEAKLNPYIAVFAPTFENVTELIMIYHYLCSSNANFHKCNTKDQYKMIYKTIQSIYKLIPDMFNRRINCISQHGKNINPPNLPSKDK